MCGIAGIIYRNGNGRRPLAHAPKTTLARELVALIIEVMAERRDSAPVRDSAHG